MGSPSRTGQRTVVPPLLKVDRPNFFGGQSLNDKDLSAILTWAEQRWRLEAACDDWGIACGLHVSVGQGGIPHVRISPGYGINSERDLCIVTEADCGCGKPSPCHCTDQRPSVWCLPTPDSRSCSNNGPDLPVSVGYLMVKPSELAIFDLWLSPSYMKQEHVLGLASNGNRNCQPSRHRLSSVISYQHLSYQDAVGTPKATESISRAAEFLRSFVKVDAPENNGTFSETKVAELRDILALQAKKYPELFGVAPPDLDGAIGKELTEARLTEILSWLVFSLRRARRCCDSDSKDQRIPLCRIWARKAGQQYEVVWIDESSPYRRTLRCRPRVFRINEWIGETFEATQFAAKLAQVTLTPRHTDFKDLAKTRAEIAAWLETEKDLMKSDAPANLYAYCVTPEPNSHPIIVGFASAPATDVTPAGNTQ